MNRETRDKFASSEKDDWETPPQFFRQLNADFGPFDIDLCANSANHLVSQWFGPDHPQAHRRDALGADWSDYRNGFANPPYGPFVPKLLKRCALAQMNSTLLLPLRNTKSFREFVIGDAQHLFFCDGRIIFFENREPRWNAKALSSGWFTPDPALFDSIVVRFLSRSKGAFPSDLQVGIYPIPAEPRAKRLHDPVAAKRYLKELKRRGCKRKIAKLSRAQLALSSVASETREG